MDDDFEVLEALAKEALAKGGKAKADKRGDKKARTQAKPKREAKGKLTDIPLLATRKPKSRKRAAGHDKVPTAVSVERSAPGRKRKLSELIAKEDVYCQE